jgi:hypothetical protein
VRSQDRSAEGVDLALPDNSVSRPFKAEVEAADSGEN